MLRPGLRVTVAREHEAGTHQSLVTQVLGKATSKGLHAPLGCSYRAVVWGPEEAATAWCTGMKEI